MNADKLRMMQDLIIYDRVLIIRKKTSRCTKISKFQPGKL